MKSGGMWKERTKLKLRAKGTADRQKEGMIMRYNKRMIIRQE